MRICLLFLLPLIFLFSCNFDNEPVVFEYSQDNYSSEALLDLRYMNEDYAGQHGFIRLSADGESFVRGDGKPIRFWSVNGANAIKRMDDDEFRRYARFLAKMGVNMARFHGSINPAGKATMINWVDTTEVDQIWKAVASLKDEGIYTTISPFWAHNGHMGGWVPEEWGIEGYSGKDALWGVMYFSDTLKNAYKSWVKYLYTEVNPYTGVALKDEPAVGLIQIKNEDGLFFWTMQNIHPELKRLIQEKFTAWLIEKYGSYNGVREAWGDISLRGDNDTIFDIYNTWEMTQEVPPNEELRMKDQVEFYTHVQYSFYKEITDFYHNELGCMQLVNANNWKTADPCLFFDTERYTYSAADVGATNRYYAPGHKGEYSGWRIDTGHYYIGRSAITVPAKLPVNIRQTRGQPMIVSESGWNLPHKYQSEAPLLVSSYMSLTGVDSYYWFFVNAEGLMDDPYFNFDGNENGPRSMNRWTYSTPGGVFMFPASALIFRNSYVKEGESVIREIRNTEDLYKRVPAVVCEENSYDPNRDEGFEMSGNEDGDGINPLAFLTGKVEVEFSPEKDSEIMTHPVLNNLINSGEQTVNSITGEMSLDYGRGIFTLDTPNAKGISGFLSGDVGYVLDGLTLKSINEYATIMVVSMDNRPLEESSKILIQTGTKYRPEGWKEKPARFEMSGDTVNGFKIMDTGHMPWLADPLKMELEIRNEVVNEAILLDNRGYQKRILDIEQKSGVTIIQLPENATYIILRKS